MNKLDPKLASFVFEEGIYIIPEKDKSLGRIHLKMKGNIHSNILCLFFSQKEQLPNPGEMQLAENIMKAINISKSDFCWSSDLEIAAHLDQDLNKKYIFIFDSLNEKTGFDFPLHEWIQKAHYKVLRSYSLDELNMDTDKKRQLWAKLSEIKFE